MTVALPSVGVDDRLFVRGPLAQLESYQALTTQGSDSNAAGAKDRPNHPRSQNRRHRGRVRTDPPLD